VTGAPPLLVLCLGNDFRRDDGAGWRLADLLESALPSGTVVRKSPAGGLHLLDELLGYDRAIVVDAIRTGRRPAGTVLRLGEGVLRAPGGVTSHAVGLTSVLELGRRAGLPVPSRVEIVAIEVEEMHTLGVGLSGPVEAALPAAVREIHAAIRDLQAPPDAGGPPGVSPAGP